MFHRPCSCAVCSSGPAAKEESPCARGSQTTPVLTRPDYALPCPAPAPAGVGVVEENGPGASKYQAGQRVVGAPWPVEKGNGTWQQFMAVREDRLVGGWVVKVGGGWASV